MKKRILALVLVALMTLPVLAGCAEDTGKNPSVTTDPAVTTDPSVTDPAVTTEPELKPDLPEIRFDGTELVIIHNPAVQTYYYEPWIYSEGYSGDLIGDSVYERNMIIEEKYGIKIVSIEDTNPANTAGLASQAQSDEYDVAMCQLKHVGTIAPQGMLHNIADLPYVNYDNPWWDSNSVAGTTYNGQLYGVVSDISMMTLSGVRAILFNRDLAKDYDLDDPYELVKNNEWTLDKMGEMIMGVTDDLDGDQAYTDQDRYGMLTEGSNINNLAVGCGIQFTALNSEGGIDVTFLNEKTISVVEKCRSFLRDDTHTLDYEALAKFPGMSVTGSKYSYGRVLFAGDHFLFTQGGAMLFEELNTANMESEYGIVPNPKYDTEQESYYHLPDNNTSMLTIPSANSLEDLERLGVILEDLAYHSSKTIYPTYYEVIVKVRRADVPELGEMMDIIKDSVVYEFSNIFGIDTYTVIQTAFKSGNISSTFASGKKVIENRIKQLVKKLDSVG
ncbi:MAG: extracellular solute-binding protein [Clostridia bacterium]|nr:extracellular solute-binding protein [Clostridia bacterium]